MQQLWDEITAFYHDVAEAQRRQRVAAIMAIVGGLVGFTWPEPPDPENDPMSLLVGYVDGVAEESEWTAPTEGEGN